MRRRIAAATTLVAAAAIVTGCVPPGIACPAIGFVYTAPVVLDIDPDLVGDGVVAACFPADCDPAEVMVDDDGRWSVPQEPPYSSLDTIGLDPGDEVRVVITDAEGRTVSDARWEIPYTPTSDGFCPGPVDFHPVEIG